MRSESLLLFFLLTHFASNFLTLFFITRLRCTPQQKSYGAAEEDNLVSQELSQQNEQYKVRLE
jgi:hypothetical protein